MSPSSLSCGRYCIGSYILKSWTLLSSYVAILYIWIKSRDFVFSQRCPVYSKHILQSFESNFLKQLQIGGITLPIM